MRASLIYGMRINKKSDVSNKKVITHKMQMKRIFFIALKSLFISRVCYFSLHTC